MKSKARRKRLDLLLVERGFADTPQKALALVLAGEVQVNGARADKAGITVATDARIDVTSRLQKFSSRGGFKLAGALEDFSLDPAGRVCLDLGASTGGFTDCLLQRGASRVYAVDVNVSQLDWKLRQDPRVIRIERNARELCRADIPESIDFITADVSFISVTKILSPACSVAKPGSDFLILVKPQFELPREDVGPRGIVLDAALHEKAIEKVRQAVATAGFKCLGVRPSRLPGTEGNQEYLLHACKNTVE
jgi:23S rRNA (cytidine1920-2'-O)/16S rRNA (cytidine1409-2'-O)-methyltransferase